MALFDSEQERINKQRQGNLETAPGFQRPRPNRFRGPKIKTGPETISARHLGPIVATSQSRDLRRAINDKLPIAPTLQTKELRRAMADFKRPR